MGHATWPGLDMSPSPGKILGLKQPSPHQRVRIMYKAISAALSLRNYSPEQVSSAETIR